MVNSSQDKAVFLATLNQPETALGIQTFLTNQPHNTQPRCIMSSTNQECSITNCIVPPEVLHRIFRFLSQQEQTNDLMGFRCGCQEDHVDEHHSALYTSCLVSEHWNQLSTRVLNQFVRIKTEQATSDFYDRPTTPGRDDYHQPLTLVLLIGDELTDAACLPILAKCSALKDLMIYEFSNNRELLLCHNLTG